MENPIEIDDLGVPLIFGNTQLNLHFWPPPIFPLVLCFGRIFTSLDSRCQKGYLSKFLPLDNARPWWNLCKTCGMESWTAWWITWAPMFERPFMRHHGEPPCRVGIWRCWKYFFNRCWLVYCGWDCWVSKKLDDGKNAIRCGWLRGSERDAVRITVYHINIIYKYNM